jgi:hypothetical protein
LHATIQAHWWGWGRRDGTQGGVGVAAMDRFLKENEKLMARAQTTSTGLLMKEDFNIKTLKKV